MTTRALTFAQGELLAKARGELTAALDDAAKAPELAAKAARKAAELLVAYAQDRDAQQQYERPFRL